MPRNLHSFCASNLHTCPQSCTVGHAFPGKAVPHLAYWNGMVEIKTRGPRWNNAERQSARRVTCRLVREPRQQATAWVPKLENEPACSHFYCITSCLLAHCLFGRFFLAFFPLYSGGSDAHLSHLR